MTRAGGGRLRIPLSPPTFLESTYSTTITHVTLLMAAVADVTGDHEPGDIDYARPTRGYGMPTSTQSGEDDLRYRAAMRLLETMPAYVRGTDNVELSKWVAALMALADLVLPVPEPAQLLTFRQRLGTMAGESAWKEYRDTLFRLIAVLELRVSQSLSESFVPVGGTFDVFAALSRIFARAQKEVYVVDPYLDESVLTDFGQTIPRLQVLTL